MKVHANVVHNKVLEVKYYMQHQMPGEISSHGDRPIYYEYILIHWRLFQGGYIIKYVPLSRSIVAGLFFLNFRMITATRRMARIATNSTPDAEHVPTTYVGTSVCKHGQKVKQNGKNGKNVRIKL